MAQSINFADTATEIAASTPPRPRIDAAKLIRFIASQPDVTGPVTLSDLHYIEDAGGSNGIALFEITLTTGVEPLVLRYAPGEQLLQQKHFDDEFLTLRAVCAAGIPAPTARWCEPTGAAVGYPFLVMDRLEGRAPANRSMYDSGLLAEVSPAMRKSMLLDAARFHGRLRKTAIGPEEVPHLVNRGFGASAIERELSWWLEEVNRVTTADDPRRKYLTELIGWMVAHQPDLRPATLVHGDGQIANLMFKDGTLLAGLDWELSYLGHNEADLALVAMLVPGHVLPGAIVEKLPTEAELVSAYEEAAGAAVEHWEYFKLFNLVKVSSIMVMTARYMGPEMADQLWQINAADREHAWARARLSDGA